MSLSGHGFVNKDVKIMNHTLVYLVSIDEIINSSMHMLKYVAQRLPFHAQHENKRTYTVRPK